MLGDGRGENKNVSKVRERKKAFVQILYSNKEQFLWLQINGLNP